MKKISKLISLMICCTLAFSTIGLIGCGDGDKEVLNITNVQDYFSTGDNCDTDLIKEFEREYNCKVVYSTVDTPEDMYNKLKTGSKCDLICPSDYMIEKMARENLIQQISLPSDGAYNTNVSDFILDTFKSITWGENNEYNLSQYAVGYMWGTLGLLYNPAQVDKTLFRTWTTLWDSSLDYSFTVKDSVRDTYFLCLAKKYENELSALKNQYLNEEISVQEYKSQLTSIFNDTSVETCREVETILNDLANKSVGLEVDDAKTTITTGDIDVCFAWSGDAVCAMDEADLNDVTLEYIVPEEGSNIWFDGWCVPTVAENKDLALKFLDFISRPENVIKNMEFIGYCSCIGGQEIFDWVSESFDETEGTETDLGYFFGEGNFKIKNSLPNRQFATMYPDKSIIDRCVIMSYFQDADNDRINTMWLGVTSKLG